MSTKLIVMLVVVIAFLQTISVQGAAVPAAAVPSAPAAPGPGVPTPSTTYGLLQPLLILVLNSFPGVAFGSGAPAIAIVELLFGIIPVAGAGAGVVPT